MDFLLITFSAFPSLFIPLTTVAYLGPDSVVPIASALAAAIGFVLMFGRSFLTLLRGALQSLRHNETVTDAPPPQDSDDARA